MEIYVKPAKKAVIAEMDTVYIGDVAEVFAEAELTARVNGIKILKVEPNVKKSYIVSIIDIIEAIDRTLPGHTVNNVGEMDTVIDFAPKRKKDIPFMKWLRIGFVSLVLFTGGAAAIMSFHTDAQIPTVFKNINYMLFNVKDDNPLLVHLPYSIGLGLGIVTFFNHLAGRKITGDPTPIEVEMSLYEKEVNDRVIDVLNREKEKKRKVKSEV